MEIQVDELHCVSFEIGHLHHVQTVQLDQSRSTQLEFKMKHSEVDICLERDSWSLENQKVFTKKF